MSENSIVKKQILFLSANPIGTNQLRLDEEVREVGEGLKLSKKRNQFQLNHQWAVRLRDMRRALLNHSPQILHFTGHGEEKGLLVEDEQGFAKTLSREALSGLLKLFSNQIECVILSACYSFEQAEAINKHIKYVIGMKGEIKAKAAIEFSVGFYDALGADKSIKEAFEFGCNAIQHRFPDIPEHLIPVLKINERINEKERIIKKQKTTNESKADDKSIEICFVIMPFKDPFNAYYRQIIKPAIENLGLMCLRSDEIFQPNSFIQTIWDSILASKVIIAEMTGMNPNVLYELGLCHAINKTVIMLTQRLKDVPSDLRHMNCILYDTSFPDWDSILTKKINRMLEGAKKKRQPYLRPIPDFKFGKLKKNLLKQASILKKEIENITSSQKEIQLLYEDSEKKRKRLEKQNQSLALMKENKSEEITVVQCEDGVDSYLYPIGKLGQYVELVKVPEGPFVHGPKGAEERIVLPTFYISRFAITNQIYTEFLNEKGNQIENGFTWIDLNGRSKVDKCRIFLKEGVFYTEKGFDSHPVTYVNWYGANAFCQWAGGELPTETQWEKAARGVDGRYYPWGNQPPNNELVNYGEKSWHRDTPPIPVDRCPKGISPYGCYQMVGNVWYWTSTYYADRDVQAVRGGSFFDFRVGNKGVYRFFVQPDGPDFSQGFHFIKRFI